MAIWEEVKRLIQQDPQLIHSGDDGHYGYTPLHHASEEGNVGVAAWLVDHGAHINETSKLGSTAFLLACIEGHVPVVELLLGKGADATITTDHGITPLMVASSRGYVGVVRCLLQHPQPMSTVNHRNEYGYTALYGAWYLEEDAGMVRLFLEAGADPTIATNDGMTPVDEARAWGRDVCVELLEEWERHYLLTKARHLRDASHDDDVSQALAHQQPSSSSSSSSSTTPAKRARVKATPTYLMGRVVKGEPLPTVEVADVGGGAGNKRVREVYEGLLVMVVFEHVVCGGLRRELFVELMEVMGRTGYRKDRKKKEGEEEDGVISDDEEEEYDDDGDGNDEEEGEEEG